jgi:polyhydroxybutyrate depolymerase
MILGIGKRSHMARDWAAIAAIAALLLSGASMPATADEGSLVSGGLTRTFAVATPQGLTAPAPLVLLLHGAGGSGENALQHYRWDREASAQGFVAAAPDAMPAFLDRTANFLSNPRYWNDGSDRGPPAHGSVDDIAFLGALIDALAAKYPIDRSRIYVTGFSSGASMAFYAGVRLSDRLAAIAPVAGKNWSQKPPARPLPVLYLIGDQDPLNPYAGGPVSLPWGGTRIATPARESPEAWAKFDACDGAPAASSPEPQVTLEAWRHCAGGAEVLFYTVAGLGHEWAGGTGRALPAAMTGPYSDAVDTTALIWDFFRRHRRQ